MMNDESYMVFDITESPEEIAKNLVQKLLVPLLTAKLECSGEIEASKLYHSIHFELGKTRANMIGQDAIHELIGIVSELEEEHFPEAESVIHIASNTQKTVTFLEINNKPS